MVLFFNHGRGGDKTGATFMNCWRVNSKSMPPTTQLKDANCTLGLAKLSTQEFGSGHLYAITIRCTWSATTLLPLKWLTPSNTILKMASSRKAKVGINWSQEGSRSAIYLSGHVAGHTRGHFCRTPGLILLTAIGNTLTWCFQHSCRSESLLLEPGSPK